jgi:hypothetical protein
MNQGGVATTRVRLNKHCAQPMIGYHQHSNADTSINGGYFIASDAGGIVAQTTPTENLCNTASQALLGFPRCTSGGNCWCPWEKLPVILQPDEYYHFGFINNPTGDMSGPSSYAHNNLQQIISNDGLLTVTFDNPREDPGSGYTTPFLPAASHASSWQAQWMLECDEVW